MLTRRATYGIRALAGLAQEGGRPQSVSEIARREGIPQKFLAGILADLRRVGIVHGQRGRIGGYWLAVPPGEISVALVIAHLSGPFFPFPCLDVRRGSQRCRECPGRGACAAHTALLRASQAAHDALRTLTLSDLIRN